MPKISVVMSVRNGARYLERSLSSILAQDLADFELIVVNDHSEDGSAEIMKRVAAADSRVMCLNSDASGLASALNYGVASAAGEWIARMDADDVALPNRLTVQLVSAQRQNVDLLGCSVRTFGATLPRTRRYYRSHDAILLQLLFGSAFCHPAVFVRRSSLDSVPYDPTLAAAQDYDLWTKLAVSNARMANTREVLLRYRVHAKQTTITQNVHQYRFAESAALRYWRRVGLLAEHSQSEQAQIVRAIFDKWTVPSDLVLVECLKTFEAIAARFGDPEGVVSDNLAKFLLRFAGVSRAPPLRVRAKSLRLKYRVLFGVLSVFGLGWGSPLYQLLRQRAR